MAVSAGSQLTEELLCSICLETYNHPVLLPCAHTFCRQCLINVQGRTPRNRGPGEEGSPAVVGAPQVLVCPQCRKEVRLGPDGVAGLPKNTSMANIILSIEEDKRHQATVLCEVCDYDPARAAFKKCADCSVTYCLACFRQCHPMRGAFRYHVIKEANERVTQCASPLLSREASLSRRDARDGWLSDGGESCDENNFSANQNELEAVRRLIKSKRKDLNGVSTSVQNFIKTAEEETEERMREVRSLCGQIGEQVGEREAALLNSISQRRHEAVRLCQALFSDVKAQAVVLDLLEDQVNDVMTLTGLHANTDAPNDIAAVKTKVTDLHIRPLTQRVKQLPRQPKLEQSPILQHVAGLDFVKEKKLVCPVMTEFVYAPVSSGPAHLTVKWRPMKDVKKFTLSATHKEAKGQEVMTSVDLAATVTSYQLCLPHSNAEYTIRLKATSETEHPEAARPVKTLPYVHCFRPKFNPVTCHKRLAVSTSRDELIHRKCKLSNTHSSCPATTSSQRLENCEGATADDVLPLLPHVYWEAAVHFKVFGKLGDSKLLCDVGVVKPGHEDSAAIVCDNPKSYSCFLVRRGAKVALEFWNGPERDILPRSIPLMDLDKEKEKTIKLGFYFDAMKRKLAVVSPGSNSVLCEFKVKFPTLVMQCGLYSSEHVYVLVKLTDPLKLPNILTKLMRPG